jgi:hypothetical protein
VLVTLLVFTSLITTSMLWMVAGGSALVTLPLILAGIIWLVLVEERPLWNYQVVLGLLLFASAAIPALYWTDPRLMIYPIFLFLSVALVGLAKDAEISVFIDISSWILLLLLLGGVAGFLIAQSGMAPVAEVVNRDGRPIFLFYTTWSNVYVGNFIRPAGIYDEPGALSFFVCAVVYMRYMTGKSAGLTAALLVLGFITFSLAHLVFATVFSIALLGTRQLPKAVPWVVGAVALTILSGLADVFQRFLLGRLTLDAAVSAGLAGTRATLLANAAEALRSHGHSVWVGLHPDCTFNTLRCSQIAGPIAENPLGPLAAQGIFMAWPYYAFLLLAFLAPLTGRRGWALAAVGLLFVQRPYVSTHGYSLFAVAAIWLFAYGHRFLDSSGPVRTSGGQILRSHAGP